jgi:hypothetical protein
VGPEVDEQRKILWKRQMRSRRVSQRDKTEIIDDDGEQGRGTKM